MASDKFAELWVVDPKRPKRRSWLVDSNRIATKIKIASGQNDPHQVVWNSNPTRHCPNCHTSLTTVTKLWLARLAWRCEIWSLWSGDHLPFASKICVKHDGTVSHFSIELQDFGDVCWHKTGRTKLVVLDGTFSHCHGMFHPNLFSELEVVIYGIYTWMDLKRWSFDLLVYMLVQHYKIWCLFSNFSLSLSTSPPQGK